jgi:anti-sigma regulatory factor (Ser/Thr protein kinase)
MDPVDHQTDRHEIRDPEDVGSLRRAIRRLAGGMGIGATESARIELAATELATNILVHAGAPGYVLVQMATEADGPGIEVVAVDRGPGISEVDKALGRAPTPLGDERVASGMARRGGLGCGLASVERLASEFDLYSLAGWGTAVLARFRFAGRAAQDLHCGGIAVPLLAGTASGDAWAFKYETSGAAVLLADGLGHGVEAARAAAPAVTLFHAHADRADLEQYLHRVHEALRATRGAAVSVCRIDSHENTVFFAGIGNVEGRLYLGGTTAGLAPRNGTMGLGLYAPKIQVREYKWAPGARLLLHSDGIRTHFDFGLHRALPRKDPVLVAAVLHRDLTRERDDATLVTITDMRMAAA